MLQTANTDLYNQLIPKAHNSECQYPLFPLQIKPIKVNLKLIGGFLFFYTSGTNGSSFVISRIKCAHSILMCQIISFREQLE